MENYLFLSILGIIDSYLFKFVFTIKKLAIIGATGLVGEEILKVPEIYL